MQVNKINSDVSFNAIVRINSNKYSSKIASDLRECSSLGIGSSSATSLFSGLGSVEIIDKFLAKPNKLSKYIKENILKV